MNAERAGARRGTVRQIAACFRESAKLWEERGNDKERAFEAVRDAFVLDPDDGDTRAELDRLAAATSRWDDLAEAYERAASRRSWASGSASCFRRWPRCKTPRETTLDVPSEPTTGCSGSTRPRSSRWRRWTRSRRCSPTGRCSFAFSSRRPSSRRATTRERRHGAASAKRAATCSRTSLAQSRRTSRRSSSITRGASLSRSSSRSTSGRTTLKRLVDLYRQRVEQLGAGDEARKYELLILAANAYESGIKEPREAIELLNEALAVKPGDAAAMRRLDALYTSERLWPELLENLRLQASAATDDAARRALKRRIGDLLSGELRGRAAGARSVPRGASTLARTRR